ncbi:family 78 glycoside hydrolase catalytic domain [Microterricola pindariensis]|uniref:alpha-L-rhamnosidase n=1 Tax=Microterricola pindariensis TaxID=478010 RepID=A0ABX5AW81_9MICO|nr:family 78 glycoside hydrolase catalytic domain [Microterricola pindariensis]PPL19152.1 alpha-L-rhamnosidase [Microterricola pindariensis]
MSLSSSTTVASLTADLAPSGPFVGGATPRLSWRTRSDAADWLQRSAQLEIQRGGETHLAVQESGDSSLVNWPFAPIEPREQVIVRVRVTGTDGASSPWSSPLELVGGFLPAGDWRAQMIGAADAAEPGAPFLARRTLTVTGAIARATLYAAGHGVYQAAVNGRDVDDHVMKPGWTGYTRRLTHETSDVTALLRPGANEITVRVAAGWYAERLRLFGPPKAFYGEQPAVAAQLVIEYTDGRTETLVTDGSWESTLDGPLRASGLYAGEHVDSRRAPASGVETGWLPVRVDGASIVPRMSTQPPVRAIEEVPVQQVITAPSGAVILDFGQNLVGVLRISVNGAAGDTVTLRHAEVLENGELGTRPLREAQATDSFVCDGSGPQEWQPEFTFHGFRYAEVSGWPGDFDPADVVAVVLHTDMARTGWFHSSDATLDRFHENVVWGMRGNFLSIPTDCPQRNERLGWTGDIGVFAPTASYLYDCRSMLASWLEDLAIEQQASNGVVPFFVPSYDPAVAAAAGWGDAATVVPWALYERFGDAGVLAEQYESMSSWVDTIAALAGQRHLWEGGFQFGDWLDPDAPPESPAKAKADPDIVATAYLWRSSDILAKAAAVLGHTADATRYRELAERVRTAFLREYATDAGRLVSDSATPYGLAIVFGLARDDTQRQQFGDRLATLVRSSGYLISTGFLGTPLVTDALSSTGHHDAAARLLFQKQCPSWLYQVRMGATTVWERWDSMLEDGSINPGQMTSFNHYSLGSVADWMHRELGGLSPLEPGYRRIRIAPRPVPQLQHAQTEHDTPYGRAASGWERTAAGLVVTAVIPPNTRAEVLLPGAARPFEVGSGRHEWRLDGHEESGQLPNHELGSQTPLAEIIDDEQAFSAIIDAIESVDADRARAFHRETKWRGDTSLGDVSFFLQGPVGQSVTAAIAALNAARARARAGK